MIISNIENKDYNVCHECGKTYSDINMYKIITDNFKSAPSFTKISCNIYCKACLFKLLLELNNIFELHPLMDGATEYADDLRTRNEIPPSVLREINAGRKVAAIKEYRRLGGKYPDNDPDPNHVYIDHRGQRTGYILRGLKESKDQVEKWMTQLDK
jgi:hypothetical protein